MLVRQQQCKQRGMTMSCCDHASNDVKDPVCGMKVDPAKAAATVEHEGAKYYFCCQGCAAKFRAAPEKYLKPVAPSLATLGGDTLSAIDPVCGMKVDPAKAAATVERGGANYYFCSRGAPKFRAAPEKYLKPAAPSLVTLGGDTLSAIDPVCGMKVDPAKAAATVEHEGANFYFCSQGCAAKFRSAPEKYLAPKEAAAPLRGRPRKRSRRRNTSVRWTPRSASWVRAPARSAAWRSSLQP